MRLPSRPAVGILYPGEMGAALGGLLRTRGLRVATTAEGRSERTRERCRAVGLTELPSLEAVVGEADLLVSLVHPGGAVRVAEAVCAALPMAGEARPAVYLDLNSISPAGAAEVCTVVGRRHLEYVDGAIHGLAGRLKEMGTLYLSGPGAPDVAQVFEGGLRTRIVGEAVGAASGFKMLLGGMSKGLSALLLEMGVLAVEAGVLEEVFSEYRHYYPGLMEAVDRLLPTYPRHAARRGEELREIELMCESLGLEPRMVPAAEGLISRLGEMRLEQLPADWTAEEVIRRAHARGLLDIKEDGVGDDGRET